MKKTATLFSLIGYALCSVSFLIMFVRNLVLIPALFDFNAAHVGNLFIALVVVEGLLLLLSLWGLLGTMIPLKKWTMPFALMTLVVLGALAIPLISLSVQTNDNPDSEMNLLLAVISPLFLWTFVTIGNIPGAIFILLGVFQKQAQPETSRPIKKTISIDFGAKDEMSLEVERFKTLYKEGLLSEEEAQRQIRDLEPTLL